MAERTFANKTYAHLASGVTSGETTFQLIPGDINYLLPYFSTGTWLYLVLCDYLNHSEIVKVTAITGDYLTVERGQTGTSARAWYAGTLIMSRPVAQIFENILQKGIWRSGDYNPNGVLAGEFVGEKFHQTGPAADQDRWWIYTKDTNKWRLLTGSIYGDEYTDSESFIFTKWKIMAESVGTGGLLSICVFNDKIYCGSESDAVLYEWDGIDSFIAVATLPGGGSIIDLLVFNLKLYGLSGDGKLLEWDELGDWIEKTPTSTARCIEGHAGEIYGAYDWTGILLKWNGIDAWISLYSDTFESFPSLISFGGTLYALTANPMDHPGAGGYLLNWTGATFAVAAPRYSGEQHCMCSIEFDGGLFAGVSIREGALLQWNEINAWVLRGQANPLGTGGSIWSMTILDGELYALQNVLEVTLVKWNGVDELVHEAEPPYEPGYIITKLATLDGSIYAISESGILWRYNL